MPSLAKLWKSKLAGSRTLFRGLQSLLSYIIRGSSTSSRSSRRAAAYPLGAEESDSLANLRWREARSESLVAPDLEAWPQYGPGIRKMVAVEMDSVQNSLARH
jgi:hypothetical protein